MSETSSKKRKVTAAVATVVAAALLLVGGTFAWQSINQTALNEASDVINPGGRLHDDFNGTNKDVYVENFADDPIFARVRLDEYFEIVMNKGAGEAEKTEIVTIGATKGETDTYVTHIFGETNDTEKYWNWTTGGSTVYMPTFNMNKDSLVADINGTYNGLDGVVTDDADDDRYSDYVAYLNGDTESGTEIYDADTNDIDEFADGNAVLGTNYIEESAEHTAQTTLGATLMSMQEWIDAGSHPGEYWVYDTDGWVYWAQAIEPDTATGLLLNEIGLNRVMDDSWYYAINVVAQFVTADDLGRGSNTGFYDLDNGTAPTPEALELLDAIGVDITSVVSDADSLKEALENGSDVVIDGTIDNDEIETVDGMNVYWEYLWANGGNMSGGTLNSSATDAYATLFINNENNWPEDGDGAYEATLEDTTINTAATFGIYNQAIDAPINIKNVEVNGANGGIYSEYGNSTVTLDNVTVVANGANEDQPWFNSAVAAGMSANVVVNSGSYKGEYAAYVYSSGATLTINGGYFDGKLQEDNAALVIKGGTFTADPTKFVADGYEAVYDENAETWTVQEKAVAGLTYTVVSPENWDGALARKGETSVTLKVDGDYTADDLEWSYPESIAGATCAGEIIENEDGSAVIKHTSVICGGGGFTVRVSLISDPDIYLDIEIGCDN